MLLIVPVGRIQKVAVAYFSMVLGFFCFLLFFSILFWGQSLTTYMAQADFKLVTGCVLLC